MTYYNDSFAEEIRAGIPDRLPQPKPYDTSINHAPRRKDILTPEEKRLRSEAIQRSTLFAAQIPLETMRSALDVFPLCKAMVEQGNPNSVSDAGVGALAARAAVLGAGLNVKINAASLKDKEMATQLIEEAECLMSQAQVAETEILEKVREVIAH